MARDYARQWQYADEKPRLENYPSSARDQSLADLDASLDVIGEYQRRLWANQQKAVLLIIHGVDASGKDSLIRTLATFMDPAGFHAWSFSRPTKDEARHDFLWRVFPYLPAFGEVVAFNRSHHEAVMAERLWPVLPVEAYDWKTRYQSIRAFEQHLANEGTTILKFWLNVSREEHRRRLLKRLTKKRKIWKFHHSDIDAWRLRDTYLDYASEAIGETSTDQTPWFIIPGDDKSVARTIVAQIVAARLKILAPEYPAEDKEVLKQYRQLLEAQSADPESE